jgi:hypothetical protein
MGCINSKTCSHAPQTSIQHYKVDSVTLDVTAPKVPSAVTSVFLDAIQNLTPAQQRAAVTDIPMLQW